MHLDRRFVTIVVCSLLWGMLVTLVFYRMASGPRAPVNDRDLVVAARPLAPGASIAPDSLKLVRVQENLFPKGGYSKAEEVVGRPVISSIMPDEPLVESRLAARGSGFGVAPMIPSGMRAVSVRVNDVAGVAGFVLPGMRVDILATGRPAGGDDTYTATVLQNVTVLSAGQTIEADGKSQSMSVPVVTLLVDPAQAESLTLAASEGRIQLVLRNSGDQQVTATGGRQLRDLYAHATRPAPAPASTPPPAAGSARKPREPSVAPVAVAAPAAKPAKADPLVETVILLHGNVKTVETFPAEAK